MSAWNAWLPHFPAGVGHSTHFASVLEVVLTEVPVEVSSCGGLGALAWHAYDQHEVDTCGQFATIIALVLEETDLQVTSRDPVTPATLTRPCTNVYLRIRIYIDPRIHDINEHIYIYIATASRIDNSATIGVDAAVVIRICVDAAVRRRRHEVGDHPSSSIHQRWRRTCSLEAPTSRYLPSAWACHHQACFTRCDDVFLIARRRYNHEAMLTPIRHQSHLQ